MLRRLLLVSLAALLGALAPSRSAAEHVYFIGNSVTDTLRYEGLASLATAAGREQTWGRHMIPGASLDWLWNHPDDGFFVSTFGPPLRALPNHTWDVLSLQPFDRDVAQDLDSATKFIELLFGADQPTRAQQANRIQTRILVFSRWPRRDEDPGRPSRPYAELWARAYPDGFNSNESAAYAPLLAKRLAATSVAGVPLANRVFIVPVGEAMHALDARFRAGQVPGLQDVFDLYADGIHLTNVGAYVAACAYHAVIHRASPVGLPVPPIYQRDAKRPRDREIDPALAKLIQETVWTTVRAEPLSGVPAEGQLVLTTAALPSAYADRPYRSALRAAGAARPAFALASGALPPGITLAPDGDLSGQTSATGDYAFTVSVRDTAGEATPTTGSFRLLVATDLVPKISTPSALPDTPRGARLDLALAASPGNGRLAWSLADGALPPGVSLSPEGRLSGSPAREGSYEFTLRVNDEDAHDPGDTRRFRLAVGRPAYGTFFIRPTAAAPRLDGALDDPQWALSQGVAHAQGHADNTVKFAALWDAEKLHLAVAIRDLDLLPAGPARSAGDRVSVFLDPLHDRQTEFNQQHREFTVGLDGTLRERGGRLGGVEHAVLPVPGGWQLELSIPWRNLNLEPGDTTVLGLDLVNYDEDPAESSALAYARSTPDDPRPDQWASILLSSDVVPAPSGATARDAKPADEKPFAYEPFDHLAGPLHAAAGASGWGFASPWEVEGGADASGYAVVQPVPPLEHPDLLVSGLSLSGGHRYGTIGRPLALPAARGSELWVSWLVRPLRRDASAKLSLDTGGAVMHDNEGVVRVQNHQGRWRLSVLNDSATADTDAHVQPGASAFLVLRLRSGPAPAADLWVNPAPGAAPSGDPAASLSAPRPLTFDCLNLYPDHQAGGALFDEIRFGASFASVAPRRPSRLAAPRLDPLPTRGLALPAKVSISAPAPGASVHYTLDGSAPGADSPRVTGPVSVPAGATLRAVAIGPDGTPGPVSGAHYGAR